MLISIDGLMFDRRKIRDLSTWRDDKKRTESISQSAMLLSQAGALAEVADKAAREGLSELVARNVLGHANFYRNRAIGSSRRLTTAAKKKIGE